MKIKSLMIIGMGSLLTLLIIVAGIGFFQMKRLNDNIVLVVNDNYKKVELVNNIPEDFNNIRRNLRELVLIDKNADPSTYVNNIQNSNADIIRVISNLEGVSQKEEIDKVAQLNGAFENYLTYENQVINLVQADRIAEATNLILNDLKPKPTTDNLLQTVNNLVSLEKQNMNSALLQSQNTFFRGIILFVIICIFGLLIGIIASLWLIRSIWGSIVQLANAMKRISSFEDKTSLPRLEVINKSELGELSIAFNEMAVSLEQHARQERESTQALQAKHWLQSKAAEMVTLFEGVVNVEGFSNILISWLCEIVGAGYGIFYVCTTEKGAVKLINMASYAAGNEEFSRLEYSPGEGLVGQCFLTDRIINLTEAPDQYIEINTGFGKITPKHIKLLPVGFEKKVIAIIELASLQEFTALEKEFLEHVRKNIGIILNRIEAHAQVQKLLIESQTLTEELQTQSEELQTQQEELKTFHEKLEEQYKEVEQKNLQLLQSKVSLEEQASQLETSSRYKSEFLSNMSHELRTPLNSLLILARMLWENNDGNLSVKQVDYAKTIWSSGNELLNLINGILDLSKIEAGKVLFNPEEISFVEIKEDLEKQFNPIALEKELDFSIEVESGMSDKLISDKHYLKQILINLLSNALKFTHQGFVKMNIKKVSGDYAPGNFILSNDNNLIAFSVMDSGIGIAKDKQELIFEAFQQADGTTSRKYGGTGLGLSICRELVTLLGGFIELESIEGKGSTFTLILPTNSTEKALASSGSKRELSEVAAVLDKITNQVSAAKIADVEKITQNPQVSGDLTDRVVLVVDDDMRNIYAVSAALETQNIKVLFAENGQEALIILNENKDIELILMDIMMPELDGYQTMKLIREIPEYSGIPIIALTAKAMMGDREKCLEAGASDYISKPIVIDKLISLIRIWLYRR